MKPLLYLEIRKTINYVRFSITSPKRLIGILISVIWIVGWMANAANRSSSFPSPTGTPFQQGIAVSQPVLTLAWYVVFSILLIIGSAIFLSYIWTSMIKFDYSDMDFLFSIPTPKWKILMMKLARIYVRTAWRVMPFSIMVLFDTFLFTHKLIPSIAFMCWISIFLFGVIIINASTGVYLWAHSLNRMRSVVATVVGILAVLPFVGLACAYIQTGDIFRAATLVFSNKALGECLLPIKLTADLILSSLPNWKINWPLEFGGLILLAAASFALVISGSRNMYDLAINVDAASGPKPALIKTPVITLWLLKLRMITRGVGAILWKNAVVLLRGWGVAMAIFLVAAMAFTAAPWVLSRMYDFEPFPIWIMIAVLFPASLTFVAPLMLEDFRKDIVQANVLKPIPISSRKFIAAEGVLGTAIVSLFLWATSAVVFMLYKVPLGSPLLLVVCALPPALYAALCMQTAVAVIFPKWKEDQMQQLLGMLLAMLVNIFGFGIPVGVAVALLIFNAPVLLNILLTTAVSAGIAWAGICLGAYAYDRFDITSE